MIVPVKSFDLAKSRLGGSLSDTQRADLAQSMTRAVLAAATPLDRFVVCGSHDVASWVLSQGAGVVWLEPPGLNRAVAFAVERLADDGYERVIISHGDLPLARELSWVADFNGVTIVPDRHGLGTNVMSIPTGVGFRFSYGENSALAHRRESARLGLDLRVVADEELGWDIDQPQDLAQMPTLAPYAS